MRISDWSSDVCSSDLRIVLADEVAHRQRGLAEEMVAALTAKLEQRTLDRAHRLLRDIAVGRRQFVGARAARDQHRLEIVEIEEQQSLLVGEIGRASCRERVCQYV